MIGVVRAVQDAPGHGHLEDFLGAMNAFYRKVLLLPEQASTLAARIDALHYFEITVMFAVATGIALVTVVFVVHYRRRPDATQTPQVNAPVLFEFPLYFGLFGLFVLFWIIGFRQYVALGSPPEDALDVYVTAKQWMWQFSYPGGPATVGVLYVPAGQPVRLHLTSRDVIHSLFVPAFRMKRDAVPGTYTTAWFEAVEPGRFPIYCTELCGAGHSMMRAEVVVLRADEYETWLGGQRLPAASTAGGPSSGEPAPSTRLAELGQDVAVRHGCLMCHTLDGTPHIGPTWLGLYGSWQTMSDGTRIFVNEAYITESMMDPTARIVAGYPPLMPSFRGLITPAEFASVIELMKSLAAAPGVPP
ncbi:MAG TPA: cytochrome c oxidase subunit II [Longimicrobiales bacterium]|nr:cytochrome c oxidase subunit II [Longimicrobiales bacterium]